MPWISAGNFVLSTGLLGKVLILRESSFNMTRGEGDEDIEGGLRKFLDTQKGGSENLYTSKPTGREDS